ncbi:DUF2304 domain-containing protein [Paenibacillus phoenicis]|uniref:DUF2304 domain-containing protein n=1 Tax=Paenibacillus phoenicis TaxID=554117 RepID=A0ABU5PPC4_9BACL|nr:MULTISPECIES: DUF2304 domain-containing protein [Paenibacillus]EES74670.1 hypothetical protein POTG_00950 [Paenibacillus sp. oral taxon 786 str. D14]MCT2195723.1 DUF2304 domain-containing protein [Paenibacillus sp. p3-SID1389]MEA3571474.1 DUF2304 domain-containing protein [Paenibacillus phoenicis]
MSIYILSVLVAAVFLLFVLELVRRQKLREQYSLLWILFSVVLLICSTHIGLIEWIADQLGVKYAPAVLFLFGLLFCFALILHLTIVITRLTAQVLRLTQEIVILKEREAVRENGQNH